MITYKKGFTLVEMLVVMGIIAALAALLFGVLGSVREKGRQRVCASSLHQIGQAFAQYQQDWDGMDAQVGVPMTHSQLGLPPSKQQFLFRKTYKIEQLLHCPSAHFMGAANLPRYNTYISPGFYGDDNDPAYPAEVARYGQEYPLSICEMHNVNTDFPNQPTWATKWVQSVHISQQVRFHEVPASTGSMDE